MLSLQRVAGDGADLSDGAAGQRQAGGSRIPRGSHGAADLGRFAGKSHGQISDLLDPPLFELWDN